MFYIGCFIIKKKRSRSQEKLIFFVVQHQKKIHCSVCILFGSDKGHYKLCGIDIKSYPNANKAITQHENVKYHVNARAAYVQARHEFEQYLLHQDECNNNISLENGVDLPKQISSENTHSLQHQLDLMNEHLETIVNEPNDGDYPEQFSDDEITKNRHVLERIIMCLLFAISHGKIL